MRAAFYTLGCKVNQYETQIMTNQFAANSFDIVDFSDEADVYVVNSCTVTESGDKKTRAIINKARRQNPNAVIALTGCFPQAFPDDAAVLKGVCVVQGSYNRGALLENVKQYMTDGKRIVSITPHKPKEEFEPMKVTAMAEHTRAFIKIEDGCDRFCSYCIIPKARGPIRSKSLADLKEELLALAENGYKEVVLVGINLSSYGKETGYDKRLVDAVELACSIEKLERVRLGSLEPELISDDDFLKMAAQPKFCPQFHLSLQSGCSETLKRMNRHYTAEEYEKIVEKIKKQFKNPSITTDIMVGFAGETQEEFEQSLAFLKKITFARTHVFSYSIRAGTRAAEMDNQQSRETKEKRSKLMLTAASNAQRDFLITQLDCSEQVLFETALSDSRYVGYTKNYTKVIVKSDADLCGKIFDVTLKATERDYCIGVL